MPIKSHEDVSLVFNPNNKDSIKGYLCIAVWVPKDTKMKYDEIQSQTSRALSKEIRKIVINTINNVTFESK